MAFRISWRRKHERRCRNKIARNSREARSRIFADATEKDGVESKASEGGPAPREEKVEAGGLPPHRRTMAKGLQPIDQLPSGGCHRPLRRIQNPHQRRSLPSRSPQAKGKAPACQETKTIENQASSQAPNEELTDGLVRRIG